MTIALDGRGLTVADVVRVARHGDRVALAPGVVDHMRACRAVVDAVVAAGTRCVRRHDRRRRAQARAGRPRRDRRVQPAPDRRPPCRRRRAGAPRDVVRATMVRLANSFASGTPGVRPELAELVVAALNEGREPRGADARLARPGRPRADGRPGRRPPRRVHAAGAGGTGDGQRKRVLDRRSRRWRCTTPTVCSMRRRCAARSTSRPSPRTRARCTRRSARVRPYPGLRPRSGRSARGARGQLPVGRRAAPAAGSAHVPQPGADPRRRAGRAHFAAGQVADRAECVPGEPDRRSSRRGG